MRVLITLVTATLLAPTAATAQTGNIPEPPTFPDPAGAAVPPTAQAIDLAEADAEAKRLQLAPWEDVSSRKLTGGSLLKTAGPALAGLAFVVVPLVAASRLKRLSGSHKRKGLTCRGVEVLGQCRIESRQELYLVRIGSRILVVASAGGELRTLSEITDPDEVELLCSQCREETIPSPFSHQFGMRRTNRDGSFANTELVRRAA